MIKTLYDVSNKFDDILTQNHNSYTKYGKNEIPLIKSYIIENHMIDNEMNKNSLTQQYLNDWKSRSSIKDDIKVKETNDENLVTVIMNEDEYYFDIRDSRFWIISSNAKAVETDKLHQNLLRDNSMDSIWLPSSYIYSLRYEEIGKMYSIGINYKELISEKDEDLQINKYLNQSEDLSLDLSRNKASAVLDILRDSDIKHNLAYDKISIINSTYEENYENTNFVLNDLKFNGKVTARGNSYSHHLDTLNKLLGDYSYKIKNLEEKLPIKLEHGISGNIGVIELSHEVTLSKLAKVLSDGKPPFKLWGTPIWKNENTCELFLIDLHNGNYAKNLNIKLRPNRIYITLSNNSCGNTISRLLTNINQYIDATAIFKMGESENQYFQYGSQTIKRA
ncbi:hypothetical protein [Salinicoccus roseus]|uniref:hypothetical protein n=1 Tax=Salinicoccus roseus TaxID=45670 RepID=UPI0023007BD0|nr:hypothetical protein [Salinicoccus roseus]